LLRESPGEYKPVAFQSAIGMGFPDALPRDDVAPLLQTRRAVVGEMLSRRCGKEEHHGSFRLVIGHSVRHLRAELEWLDAIIAGYASPSVLPKEFCR
jgi:hypothetical protein